MGYCGRVCIASINYPSDDHLKNLDIVDLSSNNPWNLDEDKSDHLNLDLQEE